MNEMQGAPDLSTMIGQVLNDPDAVQKIMQLAGDLNGQSANARETAPKPDKEYSRDGCRDADRAALLRALKPFLNGERQQKAESIIRLLSLLTAAEKTGILKTEGL